MNSSFVSNIVHSSFRIGDTGITTTDITIAIAATFFVILMALAIIIIKLLTERHTAEPPTLIIYSSTPTHSSTAPTFPTDMHVDVLYLESPYVQQQQYMHRSLFATSASPTSSAPVSPCMEPTTESKKNE